MLTNLQLVSVPNARGIERFIKRLQHSVVVEVERSVLGQRITGRALFGCDETSQGVEGGRYLIQERRKGIHHIYQFIFNILCRYINLKHFNHSSQR